MSSSTTSGSAGTALPPRGKALLFDYLPHINVHHLYYSQEEEPLEDKGVLFVIYQSGEAYVIPLNYRTNGSRYAVTGRLLSQESTGRRLARGTMSLNGFDRWTLWIKQALTNKHMLSISLKRTIARSRSRYALVVDPDAHKSMVYDVPIQNSDMYFALKFNFIFEEERNIVRPPRKVLLSPNKELLLLFGVLYRGQDCLVVYARLDHLMHARLLVMRAVANP